MTKTELELRAGFLERKLDNCRCIDVDDEIETEEELCKIYMALKEIRKKEKE